MVLMGKSNEASLQKPTTKIISKHTIGIRGKWTCSSGNFFLLPIPFCRKVNHKLLWQNKVFFFNLQVALACRGKKTMVDDQVLAERIA